MGAIDVIWKSYHEPEAISRGYWDQALLEDTFKRGEFNHHIDFDLTDDSGAIVIINGRMHIEDTEAINADIAKLRWVVFIITGDEEALFPWREISHPMMKVWVMLPRMTEHNDASFKLPNGYRPTTHDMLAAAGQSERVLDYFFAGQNNHERRNQCVDVAKQFQTVYTSTKIIETDGFGKEVLPYDQYIKDLTRAKIVLCPSGIETPDSFRVCEALEAGCIPVVDAFSTNFKTPGFWTYLFGENIPFPVLNYWDELPALLPTLLKEWPANANKIFAWWMNYKRDLYWRIIDDVEELSK